MKKMNFCLLIFAVSLILSFCDFNTTHFLMTLPMFFLLLSYNGAYTIPFFFGVLFTNIFIGNNILLMGLTFVFSVCYLLIFATNKLNFNHKIKLSTIGAVGSMLITWIQGYNNPQYPMINIVVAPLIIYFISYNLLSIQEGMKFKEKFSINKKELFFVAVLSNLLLSSFVMFPLNFKFNIFFSNVINSIFVMLSPIVGVVGCLSAFVCNLSMKTGGVLLFTPLVIALRIVNKNKIFKVSCYLITNLIVCVLINENSLLLEGILSALLLLFIPSKTIVMIDKYIIEEQDYELKLFQESYYRCLNRNKKVQKAIMFLENQIKESEEIKDASVDIIRKNMQFLSDKLKEEDNYRIKEVILKRLDNLGIEVLGFKMYWDYFYNYRIHLEIKENDIYYKKIMETIEESIGVKLKIQESNHNNILNSNKYFLMNYQPYKINLEIKQRSKELNCCGDSYLSFNIKNKDYFLISDGMGHGKKANKQSSEALLLLKEFIELGMDVEDAIISCNAVLCCREGEQFNTLDLIEYDYYNNKINLYKNGSGCTYLEKDEKVLKINSKNLPLGIVEEMKVEKETIDVDVNKIVLTSDGFKKDLSKVILKNRKDKPKVLIDEILKYEGKAIEDDQTIVVISVIKN